MTAWTSDELATVGAADELEIASLQIDGTLRNPVTIWVVRQADDLSAAGLHDHPRRAACRKGSRLQPPKRLGAGALPRWKAGLISRGSAMQARLAAALSPPFA